LQAHITHRHSSKSSAEKSDKSKVDDSLRNVVNSISKASLASVVAAVNNAASNYTQSGYSAIPTSSYNISGQSDNHGMNISVLNSRPTNLITIHAQEPAAAASNQAAYSSYTTGTYSNYPASASSGVTYPNLSQPPPAFGYTGAYSAPTNPTHTQYQASQYAGGQSAATGYSTPYTAAGYTGSSAQTAGAGYSSAHPAAPAPTSGYPAATGQVPGSYAAAPQYGAAPAAATHQGQWTRPPPAQQAYYRR